MLGLRTQLSQNRQPRQVSTTGEQGTQDSAAQKWEPFPWLGKEAP